MTPMEPIVSICTSCRVPFTTANAIRIEAQAGMFCSQECADAAQVEQALLIQNLLDMLKKNPMLRSSRAPSPPHVQVLPPTPEDIRNGVLNVSVGFTAPVANPQEFVELSFVTDGDVLDEPDEGG